jgi:peptide/nickel transport system substrate-binding protein
MEVVSSGLRKALGRAARIIVVLVVVLIIAAGSYVALSLGIYGKAPSSTSSSATTNSSSNTQHQITTLITSPTYAPTCAVSHPSELVDESPSGPYDSLDPAYGFFTVDGYFANVFQGLVAYNGNDSTQVVPALASSWTVSSNYENYTFIMRPNTWFSNKDPVNAYVAWFSFVREIYWNAPSTVASTDYENIVINASTDFTSDGNAWPHGLRSALVHAGVPNNENALTSALSDMLSNFNDTNSTQISIMSYPHQAFVAINSTAFQINLIQPYRDFLFVLPPQWGAIQDPVYIDSHGGVMNNTGPPGNGVVSGFNMNGMPGTGPYEYGPNSSANFQSELILQANPNYWGSSITSGPLQAPHILTIVMKFGSLPDTEISDFASCNAEITFPPIQNLTGAYDAYFSNFPGASVDQLLQNKGYPLCDYGFGMNTQTFPTNVTLLRQAIVHAINYSGIQQSVYTFNGTVLGDLFLPPAPPGFGSLDNPQNIPLYSYNITLAQQLVALAGIQNKFWVRLPNKTMVGDTSGTQLPAIGIYYIVPLTSVLSTELGIITSSLANIGVTIVPTGITTGCCVVTVSPNDGIPITSMGWCADWTDPIYQQFYDIGTEVAHEPNWVNNSTLNSLLTTIPFETNSTQQLLDTEQAYQIFTQLSTIIQLPLMANYFFVQPYVQNLVYSSFQYAFLYNMVQFSSALTNSY